MSTSQLPASLSTSSHTPLQPARHPPWSLEKMRGSILRMVAPAPSTSNCLQVSSMAMLSCTSLMVELASSCEGGAEGQETGSGMISRMHGSG